MSSKKKSKNKLKEKDTVSSISDERMDLPEQGEQTSVEMVTETEGQSESTEQTEPEASEVQFQEDSVEPKKNVVSHKAKVCV